MSQNVFEKGKFIWSAGIEDTCVYPPIQYDMSSLDEFSLTDHDSNWKSDLHALRDSGATALRYGVNWPLIHTEPHKIDWTVLDERLNYAVHNLQLTVIADLVHYGTPSWLEGSFADDRYPDAIANFALEFAKRYRGTVDHITPLNEPLTTASFCGLRGIWPPALEGWKGWTKVSISIALGISRSIAAIRQVNPEAIIVHVEASAIYLTDDGELEGEIEFLEKLALLPTDLLFGLVDEAHPLFHWLIENGAPESAMQFLSANVPKIDLLGVNYYPDLTPRNLIKSVSGTVQVSLNLGKNGFIQALRQFGNRYKLPLIVTETSIEGDDVAKIKWLNDSVQAIKLLVEEGMDIRGYTWWPFFDFVDWSYASSGRNLEEFLVDNEILSSRQEALQVKKNEPRTGRSKGPFLRRMGLVQLDERDDGTLSRKLTKAAKHFQRITQEWKEGAAAQPRLPLYSGYFADPFVIASSEGFIAFGTTANSGSQGTFISAMSSSDLIDWRNLGSPLVGVPENLGDDFWAPEVVYSQNFYWMYFSVGSGISGHHIRVAKSETPTGPYHDQGVNLTPNEQFAIDAHPFQDDDGSWFMYFARDVLTSEKVGTHLAVAKMFSMTELEPYTSEVLAPNSDWQIYEPARRMYDRKVDWHTLEGPCVVKKDGRYILFYSGGNWQNESYGVSYATSDTPIGPWSHESTWSAITLNSSSSELLGPGHCSILRVNNSEDILVYHAWNEDKTIRQLFMDKLQWVGGLPVISNADRRNSPILPVPTERKI